MVRHKQILSAYKLPPRDKVTYETCWLRVTDVSKFLKRAISGVYFAGPARWSRELGCLSLPSFCLGWAVPFLSLNPARPRLVFPHLMVTPKSHEALAAQLLSSFSRCMLLTCQVTVPLSSSFVLHCYNPPPRNQTSLFFFLLTV